jgi:hypothetical protein
VKSVVGISHHFVDGVNAFFGSLSHKSISAALTTVLHKTTWCQETAVLTSEIPCHYSPGVHAIADLTVIRNCEFAIVGYQQTGRRRPSPVKSLARGRTNNREHSARPWLFHPSRFTFPPPPTTAATSTTTSSIFAIRNSSVEGRSGALGPLVPVLSATRPCCSPLIDRHLACAYRRTLRNSRGSLATQFQFHDTIDFEHDNAVHASIGSTS